MQSGLLSSDHIKPLATRRVLAVDGHDGAGKSTLARRLANGLRAEYARPFGGPAGADFLRAAEGNNPECAMAIARAAIAATLARLPQADVIVFDRCWMTVFSAIPDDYFSVWGHRIPTILCWTDLNTTIDRLGTRAEKPEAAERHRHYLARYAYLARHFDCPVIRTDMSDEDIALDIALAWAREALQKEDSLI